MGWQTSRIYNPKHFSPLSTIGSTTTGNHRTPPLMSLNPLAPAFLPSYQSSSYPPTSLCNSTTMGLPLAQLICGVPPHLIPSLVPPINQYNSDNTLLLLLLPQTNQSKPDAAAHQPTPGSSASLLSSFQHQSNCLQAINKTIKQFSQHLKAEQLDRQTLQLILLQLQNDFALLRYFLFSPVETIPQKILLSKTPLLVLYWILTLTLTLTLRHLLSHFLVLVTIHFFVLPRWALWGHPDQKQTIPQTLILSRHPNCRKPFQLRCKTTHREFANWKNCLPTNFQLTHPSLRGSIPTISSYTINFASSNLDIQMSLLGKIPQ